MSSQDSPLVKPEVVFTEDLLNEIATGRLRIPRFQRPFVWKPSNMIELFDSIYKGYPIGGLLFWEPVEAMESLGMIGPLKIPKIVDQPLTYVLDGQQRLTTLYVGLRLPEDLPIISSQDGWQWRIWFDLYKEEFTHVKKTTLSRH